MIMYEHIILLMVSFLVFDICLGVLSFWCAGYKGFFCQRYLIPRLSHVKTRECTVNTLIFSMQNMKNAGQPFISTKHVLSLKTTRHTWCFNIFYGSFIHSFDKNSCCLTSNRSLVWVIMRLKLFNFVIWKFYITDISRGKLNRNFHTKMR